MDSNLNFVSHANYFDLYYSNCGWDAQLPPNNVCGPFINKYYILQYIPSGCGKMTIDDVVYNLHAGDCVLLFPGQIRKEEADGKSPWSFIWLDLMGRSVDAFVKLSGITRENPVVHNCDATRIPAIMEEMAQNTDMFHDPNRVFRLGAKIFELFDELSGIRSCQPAYVYDNYVDQAVFYLESHSQDKTLTIDSVSKFVGLNRSYLYKLFKEKMGMSPQEYLTHYRINKACVLLLLPQATIVTIAASVGYDPFVFSKTFKRIMGMSPSEYRNKILPKR